MIEVISEDEIVTIDVLLRREGERDTVGIFVLRMNREGEVRRRRRGVVRKAAIVLHGSESDAGQEEQQRGFVG